MTTSLSTSTQTDVPGFLQATGEMAQRTRDFDWSSTPIGPMDTWRQSLRTTLSIILRSKFPMFIWWGPDLIQFYNDAYRPSLGNNGKHPTALGQPGKECWPEIWPVIHPLIEQVLQGGESTWSEDQLIPIYRNGVLEDVYWTFSYSAIIDDDGSIGGVLVVCDETTDKETARLKQEQAEKRAWLAVDSADLGTYEYNLVTEETTSSDRFNTIWGITDPKDRQNMLDRLHPDDWDVRLAALRDAPAKGTLAYEARVIWTDRSQHWVKVKGTVVYDLLGKPSYILGVVQDITEQKDFAEQLHKQVQERTLELQRSNNDLLQFAHVITHDLKEPVRKIKVFSNRVIDETGDTMQDNTRKYLDKIQNAASRMSDMIEGVLNYSSLSSSEMVMEVVDLNDVIKGIQTDLELLIQHTTAQIIYKELPIIEGVPILLHQLFYNLINNSLKFTKPGVSPVITLSSTVFREAGREMVQIAVTDNGIGFDQEYADSIFNSFIRLNSKDSYEGTGLGLSLGKKIAERHGGHISAVGSVNKGASVIVTLPLHHKII